MRVGIIPESLVEWLGVVTGRVPAPLYDTLVAMWQARTVMVAVKLGVFEALADEPLAAEEVATRCETALMPTEKLLGALAGARYLKLRDGRYALRRMARRWLLRRSEPSLRDNLLLRFAEWDLLANYETFARTGRALDIHRHLDEDTWRAYPGGMRALASLAAGEVARRTPVPPRAERLLDIGGAHGHYAATLCRRYPRLRGVVLDLPEMVTHASPWLEAEGLGDRLRHQSGDVFETELGERQFDIVFVAQLVHHFDDAQNRELQRRIARALKPGGVVVVQDVFKPSSPDEAGQAGALGDFFFAMVSAAGTWRYEDVASWQEAAGLRPHEPLHLRSVPGTGQQAATRPA